MLQNFANCINFQLYKFAVRIILQIDFAIAGFRSGSFILIAFLEVQCNWKFYCRLAWTKKKLALVFWLRRAVSGWLGEPKKLFLNNKCHWAKVPVFKWQKMALRSPKSSNGLQKPRSLPLLFYPPLQNWQSKLMSSGGFALWIIA